ncbi:hypothetical protein DOE51_02660 [Bdellovibrio sp. NC01]|nr:hypothetical protein DOE51_02660 [Bdellovibrio sp. NC01]
MSPSVPKSELLAVREPEIAPVLARLVELPALCPLIHCGSFGFFEQIQTLLVFANSGFVQSTVPAAVHPARLGFAAHNSGVTAADVPEDSFAQFCACKVVCKKLFIACCAVSAFAFKSVQDFFSD